MTISSFCHAQLLAHGPLSPDDLAVRAVDAGVTRARDPRQAVLNAARHQALELLDGRWVAPLWLLEGRCLTSAEPSPPSPWYGEVDADLGLLGSAALRTAHPFPDLGPGQVLCARVCGGAVELSTIPAPGADTAVEVATLAERLGALTPQPRYGERGRAALRAVAQLMVDDLSCFRTPLPPLSTWVPALVEDAREREAQAERWEQWEWEQERRRRSQVVLDDCQAVEVELAAGRAGVPVNVWVTDALDRALAAAQLQEPGAGGVVISFGDRWRRA
jgi:hypothetical protein